MRSSASFQGAILLLDTIPGVNQTIEGIEPSVRELCAGGLNGGPHG